MQPRIMGILNLTPDSCYDQGRWFDPLNPDRAIQRGIQIWKEGADILDIGGESTRPGATPVSEEEEIKRILPVITALATEIPIPISIDTMKPRVAEAALKAGAALINDVSGFRDPAMRRLAVESGVPICVMHMRENPITMQEAPFYPEGIVPFLIQWFEKNISLLLAEGVNPKNLLLDPGIGFGKSVEDNMHIAKNVAEIKKLGYPVLMGLSRKSFLGKMIGKGYPELLSATLAINLLVTLSGKPDILRVHDVKEHQDMLLILDKWNQSNRVTAHKPEE